MSTDKSERITILPEDEFNRELISNVHPEDWVNPEPEGKYNLVVIGAGTAGLVTAANAAAIGGKVALVERHFMGGDCLNVGCVPSKGLIRASRSFADVRDASEIVERAFVKDGVNIVKECQIERIEKRGKEKVIHFLCKEDGFVKTYTVSGSDQILGATIVPRHTGEMIGEFMLAMNGKMGLKSLAYTIHPYPTQAKSIKRVGTAYLKTQLTPLVKNLLGKWLAWKR